MVILKCIALFFSILFSILFVNMKISSIVKLFAFNEEEDKKIYGSSFRSAWSWIKDVVIDKKYIS